MKFRIVILTILLFGCTTIRTPYKMDLINSSQQIKLTIIKDSSGTLKGELTGTLIYPAFFSGTLNMDASGDMVLSIDNFEYFFNWNGGWTHGKHESGGQVSFKIDQSGNIANPKLNNEVFIGDVISGQSRYSDTIYEGTRGQELLKNRVDRINAVNQFLHGLNLPDFYLYDLFDKDQNISFYNATKHILFPELYSYLNKDYIVDLNTTFQIADSIGWNTNYTDALFPDHLKGVRNSGSIFKDYEEALKLFQILYNMETFLNSIEEQSY